MSASVLFVPWKNIFSAGKPADSAVYISPGDTTSAHSPSDSTTGYMPLKLRALLAKSGVESAPNSSCIESKYVLQFERITSSSRTYRGVPYSAARSQASSPPIVIWPLLLIPRFLYNISDPVLTGRNDRHMFNKFFTAYVRAGRLLNEATGMKAVHQAMSLLRSVLPDLA